MSRTLVRTTRLNGKLENIATHTCTIQEVTNTKDDFSEDVESWSNISGLVDLPCFKGNESGGEALLPDRTQKIDSEVINIIGYKDTITSTNRVVVDSVTYDILNVGFDPSKTLTRLNVEVASV